MPPVQALNISTRVDVGTGNRAAIGGFIVTGSGQKKVIVRGIGPSLEASGVTNVLADPMLELHGPNGSLITTNDNWKDTQAAEITATGIAPTDDRESAIVAMLEPNAYTAVMRGKNNTSGTGLIEVYDLNQNANSRLANISTRGFAETQEGVMIGGFILGGQNTNSRVFVRGLGPSLTAAGVTDVLDDPTLDLRDANGQRVATNDNWQDDAAQAAGLIAAGIPPANVLESGMSLLLPPGGYTVILAGANGTTGNALIEIYVP